MNFILKNIKIIFGNTSESCNSPRQERLLLTLYLCRLECTDSVALVWVSFISPPSLALQKPNN
jgi:hypothetical protein